jgi:hypothetical protein
MFVLSYSKSNQNGDNKKDNVKVVQLVTLPQTTNHMMTQQGNGQGWACVSSLQSETAWNNGLQ